MPDPAGPRPPGSAGASRPAALATWVLAGLAMALASNQPTVRVLVLVAAWTLLARRLVPGRHLRPLIVGVIVLSVITVVLNGLLSHTGATVLASPPTWLPLIGGPLTAQGFAFGAGIALGLAAAVSVGATLSMVIEPSDLVDSLPWWLGHTGVAVGAALNLVPNVATSLVAVRDAQRLRGWSAPGRHGIRGARGLVDLVVPVLLGAIESSVRLGEAMEARAFGSGSRSSASGGARSTSNLVVVVGSLFTLAGFVALRLTGALGEWYPYPTVAAPAFGLAALCPPVLLCGLGLLVEEGPA